MTKEIELKLAFDPCHLAAADALMQQVAAEVRQPLRHLQLRNIYFDTPDEQLARQRIALRLRAHAGGWLQTLKTQGVSDTGLHRRDEWEMPVAGPQLKLDLFPPSVIPQQAISQLVPRFETNFERNALIVCTPSAKIEWVRDYGQVIAGEKQSPICEFELELQSGHMADLFALAARIASAVPLICMVQSKAQLGQRLLGKAAPQALLPPLENPAAAYSLWCHALSEAWISGDVRWLHVAWYALCCLQGEQNETLPLADKSRDDAKIRAMLSDECKRFVTFLSQNGRDANCTLIRQWLSGSTRTGELSVMLAEKTGF